MLRTLVLILKYKGQGDSLFTESNITYTGTHGTSLQKTFRNDITEHERNFRPFVSKPVTSLWILVFMIQCGSDPGHLCLS